MIINSSISRKYKVLCNKNRCVEYYGYTVYYDGRIYNRHNHLISPYYSKSGSYVISLIINNRKVVKRYVVVLYEAFNRNYDSSSYIVRSHRLDKDSTLYDLFLESRQLTAEEKLNRDINSIYHDTYIASKKDIIKLKLHYLSDVNKYRKELEVLDLILIDKRK